MFCLINVSGRSTYSSVRCRWQSVSCCCRSYVEQSSITHHCCPPLSPSSAVVLNHISSHFLIPPLSDSSLICTLPVQWLIILDTLIVITFNIWLISVRETMCVYYRRFMQSTMVTMESSWLCLFLLRLAWTCLPQAGYIHPDEFFQSVEVASGLLHVMQKTYKNMLHICKMSQNQLQLKALASAHCTTRHSSKGG